MDMLGTPQWNHQGQPVQNNTQDDFQQFLDMTTLGALPDAVNFDFGMLPPSAGPMDTPMTSSEHAQSLMSPTTTSVMAQSQVVPMTSAHGHSSIPAQMLSSGPNDVINEIDARIQYLQQQRLQQQRHILQEQAQSQQQQQQQRRQLQHPQAMASYFSPHQVPPTPQSLELAAGSGSQYYCSTDLQPTVFDSRLSQLKDQPQDSDFTPLVSPAVTPLESQFSVDVAFSVGANYFSPLTSPALHAQNDSSIFTEIRHLGTSSNSPVDRNEEWNAIEISKKPRKAPTKTPRAKNNVRQSPIVKPQRRRTHVTSAAAANPSIATQALSEAEENAYANAAHIHIEDAEENASVSPEALSDMPPPPLPRTKSASVSPFIQPQTHKIDLGGLMSAKLPAPATPASLMKLPASKSNGSTPKMIPEADISNGPVDSFKLPDSASFSPSTTATDIDTQMHNNNVVDNASQSSNTPIPSPVFTKPRNTSLTSRRPQILPANSTTPNLRKTPLLSVRGARRPGSVQASPALLPKISPHIKPLLPSGAEDTASRLLATKSNYQNILEGNNVPGVTYPSELSTNLTSKRTSHKIAEQGRRNRINSALQEIATLLPAPLKDSRDDSGDGDQKDTKAANAPSSKASTVEMAIEYIKQLQEEVAAANRRAAEAELKLRESGIKNWDHETSTTTPNTS
ncbi:hypothetical protein BROUX41_004954 [Berkeleyomyces rouxiae]